MVFEHVSAPVLRWEGVGEVGGGCWRAINQRVKDVFGIFVPLYMFRCETITQDQRMIR